MKRILLLMATIALTLLVSSGVVLADFVAGPGAAEPSAPKPVYAVTPLGDLGGGKSIARDINDSGQVTGQSQYASGQNRGFLWQDGQGMKPIGTLGGPTSPARGINKYGRVVGFSRISNLNNQQRAYLWEKDPPTNLGTLTGFSNSEAWHVNDFGVAVGRSFNNPPQGQPTTDGRAVLWENGQTSNPKNIGAFLNTPYSEAWSINNLGQVVGEAGVADQQAKAFLYDNNTDEVTDIDAAGRQDPDHPVFPYQYSEAAGINDHGQVIGWSYRTTTNDPPSTPPGPEGKAFLYEKGEDGTATVLPLNPLDGDLYSRARDIDESGRVVGWSRGTNGDDAEQFSAALWEDGKLTDLNDLIPAELRWKRTDPYDKSGWKLTDPYAINESGQIVGTGYHYDKDGNKGQLQGFLLTPDTTAPEVDAVDPARGATDVARSSNVKATFSEAVRSATLNSETVQLFSGNSTKALKATLSWDPSTAPTSVTLTPSERLDAKTRYTAKIKGGSNGVKDLVGNPLTSDISWSFTTGSRR
jgi:probable HAF family extracellular repeat protein